MARHAILWVLVAIPSGCNKAPDLREYCEKRCKCDECDPDECVQRETTLRNRIRQKSAYCRENMDKMTECQTRTGSCGSPGQFQAEAECTGEFLPGVLRCGWYQEVEAMSSASP